MMTMKPYGAQFVGTYYKINYACGSFRTTMFIKASIIQDLLRRPYKLTKWEEFEYEVFRKWPVHAYKGEGGKWYKNITLKELLESGELDMTGEFVEITFHEPLRINDRRVDRITKFAPMVLDVDTNKPVFITSPEEICAAMEHKYPPYSHGEP